MCLDDALALRIEGDRSDRRPVARTARPSCGIALAGPGIQRMARCKNPVIPPIMALCRTHVANAAVVMLYVRVAKIRGHFQQSGSMAIAL